MQFRKLGTTDIDVSLICLGTMTWGSQNSEAEGHAQIDYALDRGVNFLDTAEAYPVTPVSAETRGRTEEIIGSWLARNGRRERIVIATKVAGPSRGGGIPPFSVAVTTASIAAISSRRSTTACVGSGPTMSTSTSSTGPIAPSPFSAPRFDADRRPSGYRADR